MKRWMLIGTLVLAALDGNASPARISIVLHVGQEIQHSSAAQLLTVSVAPSPQRSPVSFRYDRYGNSVTVKGASAGSAKLLCEFADNRIGEVLLVTVVPRELYDRYRRVTSAMSGIEGTDARAIVFAGRTVVISGSVYGARDQETCASLESIGGVVCGARLASASYVVRPETRAVPRASLEVREDAEVLESSTTRGVEGASRWTAIVRLGDVPVFHLASTEGQAVIGSAASLVAGLNRMAEKWRANTLRTGRAYPATFRVIPTGSGYNVTSLWNFSQGSKHEVLGFLRAADLQIASDAAGVSSDRLVGWWTALLEDAFRFYFSAERPSKSSTTSERSPLFALYEDALRLHGSSLDRENAAIELGRAFFARQLVTDADPLGGVLTRVPTDFSSRLP